jgi:hypothetical protein
MERPPIGTTVGAATEVPAKPTRQAQTALRSAIVFRGNVVS